MCFETNPQFFPISVSLIQPQNDCGGSNPSLISPEMQRPLRTNPVSDCAEQGLKKRQGDLGFVSGVIFQCIIPKRTGVAEGLVTSSATQVKFRAGLGGWFSQIFRIETSVIGLRGASQLGGKAWRD